MKVLLKALPATALLATPVAAQELVTLDPATDWGLVSDDASCAMRRDFQAGDDKVSLEMRQFSPGTAIQFTIVSRDFSIRAGEAYLTLQPRGGASERLEAFEVESRSGAEGKLFLAYLFETSPQYRQSRQRFAESLTGLNNEDREVILRLLRLGPNEPIPDDEPEASRAVMARFGQRYFASSEWTQLRTRQEAEVETIDISNVFWKPLRLRSGALDQVMTQLRQCMDGKLAGWGVDPVAYRTQLRGPVMHLEGSLANMFPPRMARRGREGFIPVRIDVSQTGEPLRCHIGAQIFNDEFKMAACRTVLQEITFDPALDAAGKPMASFYHAFVVFSTR